MATRGGRRLLQPVSRVGRGDAPLSRARCIVFYGFLFLSVCVLLLLLPALLSGQQLSRPSCLTGPSRFISVNYCPPSGADLTSLSSRQWLSCFYSSVACSKWRSRSSSGGLTWRQLRSVSTGIVIQQSFDNNARDLRDPACFQRAFHRHLILRIPERTRVDRFSQSAYLSIRLKFK